MHNFPATDSTEKKKPLVIHFYNKNKVGVDVFNQMARLYTTHATTRRWPMAVWTNILNMAGLNLWILFRKASETRKSRRTFFLQLFDELRSAYASNNKKRKVNDSEEDYQNLLESDESVLKSSAKIIQ